MTDIIRSNDPEDVARRAGWEATGDAADQADRLRMIMEAEARYAAGHGSLGEGELELPYPLEDVEDLVAMADATDGSDDAMHVGVEPTTWRSAEEAAIHVVDDRGGQLVRERAALTAEDQTLIGIDPYER